MKFLHSILSKLGKKDLGKKVLQIGDGTNPLEPYKAKSKFSQMADKAKEGASKYKREIAGGGVGAAAGLGTYSAMKDDDDDYTERMEEMLQKAKKKSREWMD